MKKIAIYSVDIFSGDAVGNFCLSMKNELSNVGDCHVYASNFVDSSIKNFTNLKKNINSFDLVIFNYSIFDDNILFFSNYSNKVIIYFHNVTPPNLLSEFDDITRELCEKSYKQFSVFNNFNKFISNSTYTKNVLKNYLTKKCKHYVFPPLFVKNFIYKKTTKKLINLRLNFIFIGRVVPHKNIEEIIIILHELKKNNYDVKLDIVGNFDVNSKYYSFLATLIKNYDLLENIIFHGFLSEELKNKIINNTDICIHASKHEGFCIPVYELMKKNVICFYKKNVIPKDIGLPFNEYDSIGNLIYKLKIIHKDFSLLNNIIKKQHEKIYDICSRANFNNLYQILKNLLN